MRIQSHLKRCLLATEPNCRLRELLSLFVELSESLVKTLSLLVACGDGHEVHAHLADSPLLEPFIFRVTVEELLCLRSICRCLLLRLVYSPAQPKPK